MVCLAVVAAVVLMCVGAAADETIVEERTTAENLRLEDPAIDRGFISSHAETAGEGQVALDTYLLLVHGVSYGLTDRLQLSATVSLAGPLAAIAASGKYVLYRGEETVVSVSAFVGEMAFIAAFGGSVLVDHYLKGGVIGLHMQLGAGGGLKSSSSDISEGEESDWEVYPGAFVYVSGGVTLRLTDYLKILGEVWVPSTITKDEVEAAGVLTYGVRLSGETFAWDIAMLRPFIPEYDWFPAGIPYTGLSARF